MRIYLHAPIPPPRLWIASLEEDSPPGYMRMVSATITPRDAERQTAKNPGNSLVRVEDIPYKTSLSTDMVPIDNLRVQIERLLAAWARCDDASRTEVLAIAERLAGTAP
jgi:hypothetical protein